MNQKLFQERLAFLIESRGINAATLAANTEMSHAAVSRYLFTDRSPNLEAVIKISEYFGVSIDWLIGLSDDAHSTITPQMAEFAALYSVASEGDRRIIDAVLSSYKK